MKKLLIVPLIFLLVGLTGCNDLQAIANAENAIPQAVTLIANTSTQLVTQGSMTAAEGAKVAALLTDIINANAHAVTATQAITSLTAANKKSVAAIVTPIVQEIQASITSGDVFKIQNASAKLTITTALSALVTTLQIIQAKVGT
jgi:hypothetical protein